MAGGRLLRLSLTLAPIRPFVRAATELRCFGRTWSLAGAVLIAGAVALAALGEYSGPEAAALAVVVGLTTAGALGGVLLARRSGPDVVYWSILDRAPVLDQGVPVERDRETLQRILPAALLVSLMLAVAAPFLVGAALLMVGQPREEVLRGLPAFAPPAGGVWTLACGAAGLRMATWFERWERRRGMVAICLPLRAGLARHVYRVLPANPRTGSPAPG